MQSTQPVANATQPVAGLRRVLTLRHLIFYGIVLVQPIAAVPLFGLADRISHGHVVTVILIAMVAMLLTAVSYGRLASLHPAAGSAYTYVTHEVGPQAGFLVGWAMLLDYLIIPVINVVYGALTVERMLPGVPHLATVIAMAVLLTLLNLWGIRSTARATTILLAMMIAVISVFIALALYFLFHRAGLHGLLSTQPFYTAGDTPFPAIATATSLAALTYIGFDGVTTLSEEVENPRRNILLATVSVCLFTGLFSAVQVYLAQCVWPDFHSFPNAETAFMDVASRVGGAPLFEAMAVTLALASLGSGLSGQAAAARLLYGMGRAEALPKSFFGYLRPQSGVPVFNILAIGLIAILGSIFLNFETAAELLNFGALLGFMGVNLAAARHFYWNRSARQDRQFLRDLAIPAAGFLFCFWIWLSLPSLAKIVGGIWLLLGLAYAFAKTRCLKTPPGGLNFSD